MSSLAFLVTELQALASETRRKHPEIREAAEKSLSILRASPEQATASLAADGPQSDDLLRPVFMGCATKNAKVVAISLGSLQRLIALKAVPQSAVELIVATMADAMGQGVDIQLRILQTLLSLVTNFPAIHGQLLGEALLLCFKLQESRIAVVSSTAAATLRQLVMFVVDKVVAEDRSIDELPPLELQDVKLPDGSSVALCPSARDAFAVFQDLCLLANSEKPHFLKLEFLHKTFALELIESVVTNYHDLFRKHSELLLLLRHHLCPLLLKALSERPVFPLILRCTRVVFLLLKQFSAELHTETEVFLVLFIKIIGDEPDAGSGSQSTENLTGAGYGGSRPQWMRVLALEIMRGLCSDAELMRNVYSRYDAQEPSSNVFTFLMTVLKRLVAEKPALLGVCAQMHGVGVEPPSASESNSVAGMVATAASATVSGVVGMVGSGAGLSLQSSAMKLQCIDQLDKADSPPVPETYVYLLGLQCLVSLCEGLASFTGPLYQTIIIQRPRAAGDAPIRAPPAFDLSTLPQDDPTTQQLRTARGMVSAGWPALLAALSSIIATNLSDELFVDVLASYQAMTNVAGMLALTTPRDAFFTSLAKFAIPSRVVSSLDSHVEPATPKTANTISENLGFSGPSQTPGLSERNMACLKVLVSSALFLAGSLGDSWFGILEALQNADYVLTAKGTQGLRRSSTLPGSGIGSPGRPGAQSHSTQGGHNSQAIQPPRHPLLNDLDPESVQASIQRLFDSSKNLEDGAFKDFISALCRLSAEMVGMQTDGSELLSSEVEIADDLGGLSPKMDTAAHRRRVSGIHLPRTLRSGDFGINKLGGIAMLNMHRLIYRSPDIAWDPITSHLLSIIHLSYAPQPIRIQAARVLDDILIVVPRNLSSTGELQGKVQRRVLDVLAQQIIPGSGGASIPNATTVDLRRTGLETLHQILQASGHTFVIGWDTIFEMLASVCRPAQAPSASPTVASLQRSKPLPLGYINEKSYAALVKVAFQSLTLVCDTVSSLSAEHLRVCISTLGQFGRQADTNIALTAAESLLWSVSDSIQAKRKDAEKEPEYSALWMFLLLEILGLCTDARPEVRMGAIQTLFRTMQLYGATLTLQTWDECIWKVTFPLLDSITAEIRHQKDPSLPISPSDTSPAPDAAWDESKILALQSIGSIFSAFLTSKIMHLESFSKTWDVFVSHIQESVLLDNRSISPPALRCLEKAIKASTTSDEALKPKVVEAWERVWRACDEIGEAVLRKTISPPVQSLHAQKPFTQESLVTLVDVIRCTRNVSRTFDNAEWPLERLERLMTILKGVLTYPNSPDYRPDIDSLTPVQTVIIDTVADIQLTGPGSPSLVMRDLSEYVTLAFVASFEVVPAPSLAPADSGSLVKGQSNGSGSQKRITYIALAKKTMPFLVELFLRFKDKLEIYADATLEAVLSAYSIPIKFKYDCPAPSKFGNDIPLWKSATTSFLRIVKEFSSQLKTLGKDLPDERIEGIWRQTVDVFRGGILADCSAVEQLPLPDQEAEESFDLALIASLEIDVIPQLGDSRIPDSLVAEVAKVLHKGSRLYEPIEHPVMQTPPPSPPRAQVNGQGKRGKKHSSGGSSDFEKVDVEGTTELAVLLPRERFSYWCFDLLFLICSDVTKDQESSRRRIAALSLPSLIHRCQNTLVSYIADESLRGNLPFPRAREDELLYVLRKLLQLRLWPGSLWAALSESPSAHCVEQPAIDASLAPSKLIADAVKRSTVAHLFQFYAVLCEIASIPRKTPTSWVVANASSPLTSPHPNSSGDIGTGSIVELDARLLARECLKEIGKEISAGR